MTQSPNPSIAEIVEAAERRAASGEKVHPGFDFASLEPSPLKVAKQQAEAAEQAALDDAAAETAAAETAAAETAATEVDVPLSRRDIVGDLDNAWSRLKRTINPS